MASHVVLRTQDRDVGARRDADEAKQREQHREEHGVDRTEPDHAEHRQDGQEELAAVDAQDGGTPRRRRARLPT